MSYDHKSEMAPVIRLSDYRRKSLKVGSAPLPMSEADKLRIRNCEINQLANCVVAMAEILAASRVMAS